VIKFEKMKISLTKIRYVIFSPLLLILVTHAFFIFGKYHNMTTIGYIYSYPSVILIYVGIVFFILKKKWTDFLSLAILASIFAVDKVMILINAIRYCKEKNLESIESCSNAVIPIVFGRDWFEDALNILLVITITFLLISLLKKNNASFK